MYYYVPKDCECIEVNLIHFIYQDSTIVLASRNILLGGFICLMEHTLPLQFAGNPNGEGIESVVTPYFLFVFFLTCISFLETWLFHFQLYPTTLLLSVTEGNEYFFFLLKKVENPGYTKWWPDQYYPDRK